MVSGIWAEWDRADPFVRPFVPLSYETFRIFLQYNNLSNPRSTNRRFARLRSNSHQALQRHPRRIPYRRIHLNLPLRPSRSQRRFHQQEQEKGQGQHIGKRRERGCVDPGRVFGHGSKGLMKDGWVDGFCMVRLRENDRRVSGPASKAVRPSCAEIASIILTL